MVFKTWKRRTAAEREKGKQTLKNDSRGEESWKPWRLTKIGKPCVHLDGEHGHGLGLRQRQRRRLHLHLHRVEARSLRWKAWDSAPMVGSNFEDKPVQEGKTKCGNKTNEMCLIRTNRIRKKPGKKPLLEGHLRRKKG